MDEKELKEKEVNESKDISLFFLDIFNSETIEIRINTNTSIDSLKEILEKKTKIQREYQILKCKEKNKIFWRGSIMENEIENNESILIEKLYLEEYNTIKKECNIIL
jgi:hypothetical protein